METSPADTVVAMNGVSKEPYHLLVFQEQTVSFYLLTPSDWNEEEDRLLRIHNCLIGKDRISVVDIPFIKEIPSRYGHRFIFSSGGAKGWPILLSKEIGNLIVTGYSNA